MKRLSVLILFVLLFFALGQVSVFADENEHIYEIDPEILTDSIDENSRGLLPDDFGNIDISDSVFITLRSILGQIMKGFVSSSLTLIGIVITAAIITKAAEALSFKYSSEILTLAQVLLISLYSFGFIDRSLNMMTDYVEQINSLMTSYGAVMAEIYLLGGNITTAAVSSAWLAFALEISRRICIGALIPIIKICFALTLAASVSSESGFQAISSLVRKLYVTSSVLFMTVITVIMSFQTTLGASEDSVAMRGIKFAASNSIPIIGGLVSDSMRNLTAGISYMKNYSGIVCVICLLAVSAAPLTYIFAAKFAMSFASVISDLLGVKNSKVIFDECCTMLNYMLAMVVITDIYFIYFVTVFMKSVCALE